MPVVLTELNTSGICCWTSRKICLNDSTAKSRPETLNGPTSALNLLRFKIFPVGFEQSLVSFPGLPNFFSMVDSLAGLSPVFIVSLGGMGIRSLKAIWQLLGSGVVRTLALYQSSDKYTIRFWRQICDRPSIARRLLFF